MTTYKWLIGLGLSLLAVSALAQAITVVSWAARTDAPASAQSWIRSPRRPASRPAWRITTVAWLRSGPRWRRDACTGTSSTSSCRTSSGAATRGCWNWSTSTACRRRPTGRPRRRTTCQTPSRTAGAVRCSIRRSTRTTPRISRTPGRTTIEDFFDLAKFPGRRGMRRVPYANLEFALIADGVALADVYDTLGTPRGDVASLREARHDQGAHRLVGGRRPAAATAGGSGSGHEHGVQRAHLQCPGSRAAAFRRGLGRPGAGQRRLRHRGRAPSVSTRRAACSHSRPDQRSWPASASTSPTVRPGVRARPWSRRTWRPAWTWHRTCLTTARQPGPCPAKRLAGGGPTTRTRSTSDSGHGSAR